MLGAKKLVLAATFVCLVSSPLLAQARTGDIVPYALSDSVAGVLGASNRVVDVPQDVSFVRLHFADITLSPGDSLEVVDAVGQIVQSYHDQVHSDVWTFLVYRPPVTLRLRGGSPTSIPSYSIDEMAKGWPGLGLLGSCEPDCGDPCGSVNVECISGPAYTNSRSVARFSFITPLGPQSCTAWVIGTPDCMMTNWHCIMDPSFTLYTGMVVEFDYECDSCDTDGACKVPVQFNVEGVLATDVNNDWALLDTEDLPYGALPVNYGQPRVNDIMYLIHHTAGGKKGFTASTFTSVAAPGTCDSTGVGHFSTSEAKYSARSSGGASGSPVFALDCDEVQVLHHCKSTFAANDCGDVFGNLCNVGIGVPMSDIVPDIRLPLVAHGCSFNFVPSSPGCPPECFLVIGSGPGNVSWTPHGVSHTFSTQLNEIVAFYPVTLNDLPEFIIHAPSLLGTESPWGTSASPTGSSQPPPWSFYAQVLLWNPQVFPNTPEQYTPGLSVMVSSTGKVYSTTYGTNIGGMNIFTETFTNSQGKKILQLPFSIPGLNQLNASSGNAGDSAQSSLPWPGRTLTTRDLSGR